MFLFINLNHFEYLYLILLISNTNQKLHDKI